MENAILVIIPIIIWMGIPILMTVNKSFRYNYLTEIYSVEGFVSTARKYNCNVFSELCKTFEGHNFLIREYPAKYLQKLKDW